MDVKIFFGILVYSSIFFLTCNGHGQPMYKPESIPDFTFSKYLDKDHTFFLKWMVNDTHVTFEVQVKTLGWVGLGFSPHGGMHGADIAVMWINSGHIFIEDRFSEGNFEPLIDKQQDWTAIYGRENETHTIVGFTRLLDTCDIKQDSRITRDTTHLIYAYHSQDIINGVMLKHEVRGSMVIFFYEPIPEFIVPEYTKKINFTMIENKIPDTTDTLYLCQIMPITGIDKKYHIVASGPLIKPGNEPYVHHMDIYLCKDNYKFTTMQFDCNNESMVTTKMKCFYTILISWTVGAEGYLFPDNVGHPFDEHMENRFIMLELHYNNPNFVKDVWDHSGLEIYLTDKLRKNEAGNIILGYIGYDWTMTIPPKQKDFKIVTQCSAGCLAQNIAVTGINIFAYILHTHLTGVKVSVKVIRSGREMEPIMFDDRYMFNYQAKRRLSTHIKILPGDTLLTECIYTSDTRENYTIGGESSRDEMCIVEFAYYPKNSILSCGSSNPAQNIAVALGLDPDNTSVLTDSFVKEYLNHKDRKSPALLKKIASKLQKNYIYGPLLNYCNLEGDLGSHVVFSDGLYYKPYTTPYTKCSVSGNEIGLLAM